MPFDAALPPVALLSKDRLHLLRLTMDSLYAATHGEVWIFDDGSQNPETIAYYDSLDSEHTRIVYNPVGLGPCGNLYQALGVLSATYEAAFVVGSDNLFNRDAFRLCADAMKASSANVVGMYRSTYHDGLLRCRSVLHVPWSDGAALAFDEYKMVCGPALFRTAFYRSRWGRTIERRPADATLCRVSMEGNIAPIVSHYSLCQHIGVVSGTNTRSGRDLAVNFCGDRAQFIDAFGLLPTGTPLEVWDHSSGGRKLGELSLYANGRAVFGGRSAIWERDGSRTVTHDEMYTHVLYENDDRYQGFAYPLGTSVEGWPVEGQKRTS